MTKAACAALSILKRIDLDEFDLGHLLKHDLSDALPCLDVEGIPLTGSSEVRVVTVLKDDTDFAAIVGVDCADNGWKPSLARDAAARTNHAFVPNRNLKCDSCRNTHRKVMCMQDDVLACVQVKPGGASRLSSRDLCVWRQTFHEHIYRGA